MFQTTFFPHFMSEQNTSSLIQVIKFLLPILRNNQKLVNEIVKGCKSLKVKNRFDYELLGDLIAVFF